MKVCFASVCGRVSSQLKNSGSAVPALSLPRCLLAVLPGSVSAPGLRQHVEPTQVRLQSGPCRPAGDVTPALRVASACGV